MRSNVQALAALVLATLGAGCDSSTSATSNPPPSPSTVPPTLVVRPGFDTTLVLDGKDPLKLGMLADSGFEYSATTLGSTDTRLQFQDSLGKVLAEDLRPDSINGMTKLSGTGKGKVFLLLEGKGSTTLRIRILGGPDSSEALDTQPDGVRMSLGANPIPRSLGKNDTDWFSFQAKGGTYYRIRSESDSSVRIQAWSERQPRNSETRGVNVLLATRDTTVRIRVRLGSAGQAAYSLSVSVDSTTFSRTEANTYLKPHSLVPGADWVAFYANTNMPDYFRIAARQGRPYRLLVSSDVWLSTELCVDSTRKDCLTGANFVILKAESSGTIRGSVEADTYPIQWTSGEYFVRILEDSSMLDQYEPNDSRGTANILDSGTTQNHLLSPYDRDWVKFRVDSGVSYLVDITSSFATVRIHADSMFSQGDNVSVAGFKSRVTGWAWAKVDGFLDMEDSGAYKISYTIQRRTDAHEPDDTRATVKPSEVNPPTPFLHTLPPGDVDWISFQADSGKSYKIAIQASGENSGFSSRAYCEGSNKEMDNGYASRAVNNPLQFQAPRSGTCTIEIRGEYTWNEGSYTISIQTP